MALVILILGVAVAAAVISIASSGAVTPAALSMPEALRQYVELSEETARRHAIDVWWLLGVVWIESNAGQALTPPGPGGTGDFAPRAISRWPMAGADGLPPDGRGWGRGLAQLDYGVHHAWIKTAQWWRPDVNLDKAASVLAEARDFFTSPAEEALLTGAFYGGRLGLPSTARWPDARPLSGMALEDAVLASYNAGVRQVLLSVSAGLSPDAGTSGGRYSSWIRRHVFERWRGGT